MFHPDEDVDVRSVAITIGINTDQMLGVIIMRKKKRKKMTNETLLIVILTRVCHWVTISRLHVILYANRS